jgi:hypothetical protein
MQSAVEGSRIQVHSQQKLVPLWDKQFAKLRRKKNRSIGFLFEEAEGVLFAPVSEPSNEGGTPRLHKTFTTILDLDQEPHAEAEEDDPQSNSSPKQTR